MSVKDIDTYVENLRIDPNLQGVPIIVEHRSNNPKRDFLFVNKYQAKHIPTDPEDFFSQMSILADKVAAKIPDHSKVLVVGFAETATALGQFIAESLRNCVYYLQTTRELVPDAHFLFEFQEEHSHATQQYLYVCEDLPEFDYVLFVDDEITTGKTILNFISKFEEKYPGIRYGVATVCSWLSEENQQVFDDSGIQVFRLLEGEIRDTHAKMAISSVEPEPQFPETQGKTYNYNQIHVPIRGMFNYERAGHEINDPEWPLDVSVFNVIQELEPFHMDGEDILIMGAEEFMYVPLLVARDIGTECKVYTHSCSRSSIDVISNTQGIVRKHKLHSAYDPERTVYLYNTRKYDRVFVIVDTEPSEEFKRDICEIFSQHQVHSVNIYFVVIN